MAKCSSVHWPRKKSIGQTFWKTLLPAHKLLTLLHTVIVIHCTLASSLASTSLPPALRWIWGSTWIWMSMNATWHSIIFLGCATFAVVKRFSCGDSAEELHEARSWEPSTSGSLNNRTAVRLETFCDTSLSGDTGWSDEVTAADLPGGAQTAHRVHRAGDGKQSAVSWLFHDWFPANTLLDDSFSNVCYAYCIPPFCFSTLLTRFSANIKSSPGGISLKNCGCPSWSWITWMAFMPGCRGSHGDLWL